jgi:hypothetical protein
MLSKIYSFPSTLEQVAEQQGKYLALKLNSIMKGGGGHANSEAIVDVGLPFVYKASRCHGNFCWKIQIFGRSEAKQGLLTSSICNSSQFINSSRVD